MFIDDVTDSRAAGEAGCCVRLAALYADIQLVQVTFLSLKFRCPLDVLLGLIGSACDRGDVPFAFDRKALDRLARLGDSIDDTLSPAGFDANDHNSRYVWVAACSNHGAKEQLQVLAKLKTAIRVRQGKRTGNVVCNRLTCSI